MSAGGERTEQPTHHRLREARRRGEVAKSADLASCASLAAAVVLCAAYFPSAGGQLVALAKACLTAGPSLNGDSSALVTLLQNALHDAIPIVQPFIVLPVAAAALALFVQVGPLFAAKPLAPTPDRMNPVQGVKQLFSTRVLVEMLKAIVVCVSLACIAALVLHRHVGALLRLPGADPRATPIVLANLLESFASYALLIAATLAAADFLYQRWQYVQDKRMSKSELKREHKDNEGDPHIKQARRQRWHELQQQRMFENVRRKADFLVRNPTHLVCAVSYDPAVPGDPPTLVGKGKGWIAQRLREIAREEDIPEVRNVPLARALFNLELDEDIPPELYVAVIEVLKWVEHEAHARGQKVRWQQNAPENATSKRRGRSLSVGGANRDSRKQTKQHGDADDAN